MGYSETGDGMCLQYGAGMDAPADWLNFDASPVILYERIPLIGRLYSKNRQRFPKNVRYGDIVRGLKLRHSSVDIVYSSHVIEHLAREDAEKAIKETFRVLKPDGLFRLVVPDLESRVRHYIAHLENGETDANDNFMRKMNVGQERRQRGLQGVLWAMLSNSRHQWMWDEPSLRNLLERHGFVEVRRAIFGDSKDPRFHSVERETRFVDAIALEAVKPGPTPLSR
jgi:predicted SAM-dependent methyltransferase